MKKFVAVVLTLLTAGVLSADSGNIWREFWWCNQHQWQFALLNTLLVLILAGVGISWAHWRSNHRFLEIFKAMPVRLAVIDATGKFYYFQKGQSKNLIPNDRFAQLPSETKDLFRSQVKRVFLENTTCQFEYILEHKVRRATLTPLSYKLFGVKTALLVSMDVTDAPDAAATDSSSH